MPIGANNGQTNGQHKNVIPPNNRVIPANAGTQNGGKSPFPAPLMGEDQGEGENDNNVGPKEHAPTPKLDVEAARKSMARMANIFADIAQHAEDSSLTRCPYKDARSRCTAKFGCRNQHFTKNPLDQPVCTARDGDLDYRSAWEVD